MTEYDYSPEAYQKYLDTQARIARWVDTTQQTVLVGPDVPPTPLGPENSPLPSKRERKSRSRPSSPPPEKSKKSSSKKRSKSISARPPTPFEHTKGLPEQLDNSTNLPVPGCPVYRYIWSPKPAKASTPLPEPSPEPSPESTPHERKDSSSRHSPQYNVISREFSEPARASYLPSYDSDNTYAKERAKPPHPAVRKRSMSFSAAASRPLNNSPPVAHYHSNSPHHSPPCDYSSYYSSHNSSPHYPSTSSAAFIPPQPPPPPASGPTPPYGSYAPAKNFGYPLPYQQYPNYDAVRRREISRSHTAPAHTMHQSIDSTPYAYNIPGYSHQRSSHQHQHSQTRSRSSSRPPSPGFSTEPQPGSIRVTFPNGKTLYMNPPNADRSQILKYPELFQVPHEYYLPKKKPLLQRLLPNFGKNNGKSSEFRSTQTSPVSGKSLRKRRSSIG